jgi:hypothetical protein
MIYPAERDVLRPRRVIARLRELARAPETDANEVRTAIVAMLRGELPAGWLPEPLEHRLALLGLFGERAPVSRCRPRSVLGTTVLVLLRDKVADVESEESLAITLWLIGEPT